jgi:hypothetical protein
MAVPSVEVMSPIWFTVTPSASDLAEMPVNREVIGPVLATSAAAPVCTKTP